MTAERQRVAEERSALAEANPSQSEAPYLDALAEYARRSPDRLHVPGHKGDPGADPERLEAIGEISFEMDVPSLKWGIDSGPEPTPYKSAQSLAAEAWGAR